MVLTLRTKVETMKNLVSVLTESPLYFTMTSRDRHVLIKRLEAKEQSFDLSRYQLIVHEFLKPGELNLPGAPGMNSSLKSSPSGS